MRFFFVSSHTNNRREPSNKNNIKGMQQQSVDVDRKEPSTQVHKSLSHRETMLRHYYNQFLFILQFSVNFSSLSSLSLMWCGVLCCNNNDDVPFFVASFRIFFWRSFFCSSIRCNLSSGQRKKRQRSRLTYASKLMMC